MKAFCFKQFKIYQDNTAMKVGTDGVLLGAWASAKNPSYILDIGTGTGLIAIMQAQKYIASTITAIEIEKNAFLQAKINSSNSPWSDRIEIIHSSIQDFKTSKKFDLIISNPPFFNNTFKANNTFRNIARHSETLSFNNLLKATAALLNKNGKACFIIPFSEYSNFNNIAKKNRLYLNKVLFLKGNSHSTVKRILLQFSFNQKIIVKNNLTIEISRHNYTKEYIKLVKDFYLRM